MIVTIGKNHGHYQIERNMVIVKKKAHEKKKERQIKSRKMKRKDAR